MVNGMGTLRLLEYSFSPVSRDLCLRLPDVRSMTAQRLFLWKEDLHVDESHHSLSVTKMLGELYCNFFYNHYGLKGHQDTLLNNYGAGEVPGQYRNVVPNFIYYAMKGLPLPITGGGEETAKNLPTSATPLTVCCGWVSWRRPSGRSLISPRAGRPSSGTWHT